MFITSLVKELRLKTPNGIVKIKPGRHYYHGVNYKNSMVAFQLGIWRDEMGVVLFDEILKTEGEKDVPGIGKEVEEAGGIGSSSFSSGTVSEQAKDESTGRSKVSKRRNRKDKGE